MRLTKLIGAAFTLLGILLTGFVLMLNRLGIGESDTFGPIQIALLIAFAALSLTGVYIFVRQPLMSAAQWRSLIKRGYKTTAYLVLNTLILFGLLNGALLLMLNRIEQAERARPPWVLYRDYFEITYPEYSPEEVEALLLESVGHPYECEFFTHYREGPYDGVYVNVHAAGFREIADQAGWPPNPELFTVFMFGGSTTFGTGVADAESIPSYVQAYLRDQQVDAAVYNFGRRGYISTQEITLLQNLLREGFVPDAVVFLDGLNEFLQWDSLPTYLAQHCAPSAANEPDLPMLQLAQRIVPTPEPASPPSDDPATIAAIIDQWAANQEIVRGIGERYGIDMLFVLQPVPLYRYDLAYYYPDYLAASPRIESLMRVKFGYMTLADQIADGDPRFRAILNLTEMQADQQQYLYVDLVHYTAAFSQEIAAEIGSALLNETTK